MDNIYYFLFLYNVYAYSGCIFLKSIRHAQESLRDSTHQAPNRQLRGRTHRDVNIKEKYLTVVNKDEVFVICI